MDIPEPTPAGDADELIDAVPMGALVAGAGGRILHANRALVAMSGHGPGELTGTRVTALLPDGLGPRRRRTRDARARPPARPVELRLRRRDGTLIPVEVTTGTTRRRGRAATVAFVRDVAEERREREAHELLRRRFLMMVEEASEYSIFMLDPDGRVITWNRGAERMTGYTRQEIVGHHFSVFFPPDESAAATADGELAEAAATGRCEDEGWRVRKDGSRFWADVVITPQRGADGSMQGFVKLVRDMTDEKRQDDLQIALLEVAQAIMRPRAEQELLELVASKAAALLDAGLTALAMLDPDGAEIQIRAAVGRGAVAALGVRLPVEGELLGEMLAEGAPVLLAEVRAELGAAASALPSGPGLVVPLVASRHCLGALVMVDDGTGAVFSDRDEQLVGVFAAQAAVSLDYARARDELQRLLVLEDRERIARELHDGAIQALFAVGMGMQGIAQMTGDGRLRERLDEAVSQIDEVIRDLRNYIFALRPGLVADRHLSQALLELTEQFERRTGVVCATDIDAGVASRLTSRASDVVQLAREALSNVGRHAEARTCRVSLRPGEDGAVLMIDDDGRGFNPRHAPGSGLGLRNLGERAVSLGGGIDIASVPGEGTTVTCVIPLPGASRPG